MNSVVWILVVGCGDDILTHHPQPRLHCCYAFRVVLFGKTFGKGQEHHSLGHPKPEISADNDFVIHIDQWCIFTHW
jgi:hypothetical protein